jgi:DNA-binding GntR family transcriptional regulator
VLKLSLEAIAGQLGVSEKTVRKALASVKRGSKG